MGRPGMVRIALAVLLVMAGPACRRVPHSTLGRDLGSMDLRRMQVNPADGRVLCIYRVEHGVGSPNKLLRLYAPDSVLVAEDWFGAHPLEILSWGDTLVLKVEVFSAHGDSAYRTWYLDEWMERNPAIGDIPIRYLADYHDEMP